MSNAVLTPSVYQKTIHSHVINSRKSAAVNAVAGSGKSTTIVQSARFCDPQQSTAMLAFNKHIASEIQSKLPGYVRTSTFHSLGMSACKQNIGAKCTVNKNKYWDIAREMAAGDETFGGTFSSLYPFVKLIDMARFHRAKISWRAFLAIAEVQGVMGVYAAGELGWGRVANLVKQALQIGVKQSLSDGVIDFVDMIWLPLFKKWHIAALDTLFIDEAQDLNKLQVSFAQACVKPGGRVIAAGDPHQAVYAFMGAMNDSFNVVAETFEAERLPLSICYRCPTSHLELAREFCHSIEAAPEAKLGTLDEISESSLATEMSVHGDNALILSRRKAPLVATCIDLIVAGVPATIRGNDVIESIGKLVDTLERGYGASYATLPADIDRYMDDQLSQLESVFGDRAENVLQPVRDSTEALLSLYNGFPECKSLTALKSKLRTLFDNRKASVILSTIHGAKGLEADWVGVLDWENTVLSHPHMTPDQVAQEKNLQLIATTRSKNHLRLVY